RASRWPRDPPFGGQCRASAGRPSRRSRAGVRGQARAQGPPARRRGVPAHRRGVSYGCAPAEMIQAQSSPVRIALTGSVRVELNGFALEEADLAGRRGRLLFALLAAERHRPLSRDELAEVLWGERLPPSWEAALRGVLSKLRAALGNIGLPSDDVLTNAVGCWRLNLPPDSQIDIEVARHELDLAEQAQKDGDSAAAA